MSKNPIPRILAFVCCAISMPMLLVVFIFYTLGVADFLFPIVLPIFIGVGAFILFIFVIIMVAMQCATNTESRSWTQSTHRPHTTTYTRTRPVYQIPMNCPSCQQEIELDRVEWRDNRTIVCSGCFADIPVDTSY